MTRSHTPRHGRRAPTDRLDAVRLLDVRWSLKDVSGDGRRQYAEGHLPSARFLDLEEVLTSHTGDPLDGRHPLPEVAAVAAGLGALGVDARGRLRRVRRARIVRRGAGVVGVALGRTAGAGAGRRAPGLGRGCSEPVETGRATGRHPDPPGPPPLDGFRPIDVETAATFRVRPAACSVDGRAVERYRGEVEPLDPRAGHIPGAVNVPAATLYDDGRMPGTPGSGPCSVRRC